LFQPDAMQSLEWEQMTFLEGVAIGSGVPASGGSKAGARVSAFRFLAWSGSIWRGEQTLFHFVRVVRRHCFVRVGRCGGKNMHILAWSCGEWLRCIHLGALGEEAGEVMS
jgi:hypothetical protein